MHPVIQAAVRQGGGGADTVVVSATTTTPPVVVWAPGAPPAGFANRLLETVGYVSGHAASWASMVRRRLASRSVVLDQRVVWPARRRVMSRIIASLIMASELVVSRS